MDIQPRFDPQSGLVPAVVQDDATGEVLMLAWMNQEAWNATVEGPHAVYWSRSRKRLWTKGESSGRYQRVTSIRLDCDFDAVLLGVEQIGAAACHTGRRSCFHNAVEEGRIRVTSEPLFDPEDVYKSK